MATITLNIPDTHMKRVKAAFKKRGTVLPNQGDPEDITAHLIEYIQDIVRQSEANDIEIQARDSAEAAAKSVRESYVYKPVTIT